MCCKSWIVASYIQMWIYVVTVCGRWVDVKNPYYVQEITDYI
jgi:hypothetical protein